MSTSVRCINKLVPLSILVSLVMGAAGGVQAERLPPLWGYGIKSCNDFLGAAEGDEKGVEQFVLEYGRYEDWLSGFISGLNLATGKDVLRGADIETALRRIDAYCGGHRSEDFFTASMDLVRMLSGLR
jgi:hypothetical protein